MKIIASNLSNECIDALQKNTTISKYQCLKFTGNNAYFVDDKLTEPKEVHALLFQLISKVVLKCKVNAEIKQIETNLTSKICIKI